MFVCLFGLDSLWSKRPYWLMEELEVITESLKKKSNISRCEFTASRGDCFQRALKECVKMALDEAAKSKTKMNT